MSVRNKKLPDREALIQHLMCGMDRRMIAARYKVQVGSVRQRFANLDIIHIERELMLSRKPVLAPAEPARLPGIHVRTDKIIVTREYPTGELGGTSLRSVSLPRISYHAAFLREAGQC
ncbi:hypothetical protein LJR251_002727 [Rhizobium rhizogenes]|uniref:hypothetical protein n=1 Tax=Rhizobium rhizogenes TaxID=359 RepID=UPI003ECD6CDE